MIKVISKASKSQISQMIQKRYKENLLELNSNLLSLDGYSVYYHELDLVRSTRREASKFINLAGGSLCLNINLGLKKGASTVKLLCSNSGANLIVCDLHVMKEIILKFTEWRDSVLSHQTQVAPNAMLLPCENI